MVDIILRPGESNPNDIRLNFPSGIPAVAPGALIIVQASIRAGVAKGDQPSTGGSVTMVTPTFGEPKIPKSKSVTVKGVVFTRKVTLIPGSAYGFREDGDQISGDWPPPDHLVPMTDDEIEIQNENFLMMAIASTATPVSISVEKKKPGT